MPVVRIWRQLIEFPLEWLVAAGVAALDIVWALRSGLSVSGLAAGAASVLFPLNICILCRACSLKRTALCAEYLALSFGISIAIIVLSYLCAAIASPLIDHQLMSIDHAMGFDWLTWARLVSGPKMQLPLFILYESVIPQLIFLAALFAFLERKDRLRELFWVLLISLFVAAAFSVILPGLGPAPTLGYKVSGHELDDVMLLRSGKNLHFILSRMTGIITFPSFHTTLGIAYAYACRKTGIIGFFVLLLNLAMLVSIPSIGDHYLIDMVGGALLALASILLVRKALPEQPRSNPSARRL